MTFKILARITNDPVEAAALAGETWSTNSDMVALSTLFATDPKVGSDDYSFTLQAAELDEAYDSGAPVHALEGAVDALIDQLNGTAAVLLRHYMCPARSKRQLFGPGLGSVAGTSATYYGYPMRDFSTVDPASASVVVAASAADPLLALALSRLGRVEEGFTWIDLWRVWDIIGKHCQLIGTDRYIWVGDPQSRHDFERSANDPAISGIYARHGVSAPKVDGSGNPKGNAMTPAEASRYIHGLIRQWVEESTGQTLMTEQLPGTQ